MSSEFTEWEQHTGDRQKGLSVNKLGANVYPLSYLNASHSFIYGLCDIHIKLTCAFLKSNFHITTQGNKVKSPKISFQESGKLWVTDQIHQSPVL